LKKQDLDEDEQRGGCFDATYYEKLVINTKEEES